MKDSAWLNAQCGNASKNEVHAMGIFVTFCYVIILVRMRTHPLSIHIVVLCLCFFICGSLSVVVYSLSKSFYLSSLTLRPLSSASPIR